MRNKKIHRRITAAALAAVMVLALAGCGGKSSSSTETAYTTAAYDNAAASDGGMLYAESRYQEAEEAPLTADMPSEQAALNESTQNKSERKLIKTVNLSVETAEYDTLVAQLGQKVEALGGYTEYFSTSGTDTNRYGSMTARIPRQNLDAFLETVAGVSNITYRQENVEDVTLSYVDLESRKRMLQKEQERLLELLGQAETIEDIILLESRLTEVQYQLESMEAQLRTYDNRIDYSTVYLDIREVVRYTPQEPTGAWDRIRTGFSENLYAVWDGIVDFGIGMVIHIPNIAVFLVVAGILALIVRTALRRHRKKQEKRQQAYMQAGNVPMQGGSMQAGSFPMQGGSMQAGSFPMQGGSMQAGNTPQTEERNAGDEGKL